MLTFKGYPRADGTVGIRNHVVVLSTVVCSNGAVLRVAEDNPGLISLCSVNGCGNSHYSGDFDRVVESICMHPNVYAAVIIGLGCEPLDAKVLGDRLVSKGYKAFYRRVQLDGGSDAVCEEASAAAKKFLAEAAAMEPVDCPVEKLKVGFRFADEDAYSNLFINPAFGDVADWLIEQGGTAIVSQTSSFLGGEKMLIDRSASDPVAAKLNEIYINSRYQMEKYYHVDDIAALSERDRELGFSTAAERAAAHFSIAGHTQIRHVTAAGASVLNKSGLIFQDGTALDTAGVTDLLAAGAQMAFLSSSRISMVGWPAAPLIKVATNSEIFRLSPGDMDVDGGLLADGKISRQEMNDILIKMLLDVANGAAPAAEAREHDGGLFETHFQITRAMRDLKTPVLDYV